MLWSDCIVTFHSLLMGLHLSQLTVPQCLTPTMSPTETTLSQSEATGRSGVR